MQFEYTAIPAPSRSEKVKEVRTTGERYALTLTAELNRMAADGWEYLRADVLPSEERSGLTGRHTVYHNLLIFRREIAQDDGQIVTPESKPVAVSVSSPTMTGFAPAKPVTETVKGNT